MERKLTAILAADVVGYSALMERDEAGTFDRLKVTEQIRRLRVWRLPSLRNNRDQDQEVVGRLVVGIEAMFMSQGNGSLLVVLTGNDGENATRSLGNRQLRLQLVQSCQKYLIAAEQPYEASAFAKKYGIPPSEAKTIIKR